MASSTPMPNPEERPIFMDEGKVICDRCINKEKHGNEEPCCSCKWLTGIMSDPDFYKKSKESQQFHILYKVNT